MTAPPSDPSALTLVESARLIGAGKLSSVELTECLVERTEALGRQLNVYIRWDPGTALEQARAADRRRGDPQDRGPLHGVPVAIKDLFDVRGEVTSGGSPIPQAPARRDAFVVGRLRAAGAILLGKTLTHEWALGTTSINPFFGPVRNPWDLRRHPGGSSGGNAAGLAARLFAAAVGTDTGGSVRIPAAHCGVVALKPSRGRVSLSGVTPLAWTLDHAGPMARDVPDVAALLAVIEGYDRADPVSAQADATGPPSPSGDLAGLRIGLPSDYFWDSTAGEVVTAVRQALEVLADLGAEIVSLPDADWAGSFRAGSTLLLADAAAYHRQRLASAPERFGADVLERLRRGESTSGIEYALARRLQDEWRVCLIDQFDAAELIATPTTRIVAQPIETTDNLEAARTLTALTAPFNFTGVPALSLPCGADADGLPIGLQLVAPWWREDRLLAVGAAYQQVTNWHLRRPDGFS